MLLSMLRTTSLRGKATKGKERKTDRSSRPEEKAGVEETKREEEKKKNGGREWLRVRT